MAKSSNAKGNAACLLLMVVAVGCSARETASVQAGKGEIDNDPACKKYIKDKLWNVVGAPGQWWEKPVQLLLSERNNSSSIVKVDDIVKVTARGVLGNTVQLNPDFTRRQFVDVLHILWRSKEFHLPLPADETDEDAYINKLRLECAGEAQIASVLDKTKGGQYADYAAITRAFGGRAGDPLKQLCQLTKAGVFQGRNDGQIKFEPGKKLTVGELTTLLAKLKGRRTAFSSTGDQAESSKARFYDRTQQDFRAQAFCPNWNGGAKDIAKHWAFPDLHSTAEYWVGEKSSGFAGLVALDDPCEPDLDRPVRQYEALASMYLSLGELCMRGAFQKNVVAAKANKAERSCQSPQNPFCNGREDASSAAESLGNVTDPSLCSGGRAL